MSPTPADRALIDAAREAREHAYAPYSRFRVGAALRLRDGRVFSGVNLENCSYGLTVCAERNAVAAAVLGGARPGDLAELAIVTEAPHPSPPCGACRQVLAELAGPDLPVHLHNLADGATDSYTLGELLPHAFSSDSMPE